MVLRTDNSILSYSETYNRVSDAELYNLVKSPYKTSFTSKSNNLGIITFRVISEKLLDGVLIFKFKPSDSADWSVVNSYDIREFYYLSEYPFGFDKIENSKNVSYDVELSLLDNNKLNDSVYIDPYYLKTQHSILKENIFKRNNLLELFLNKLSYSFHDEEFLKLFFYYFLVILIFFFLVIYKSNKRMNKILTKIDTYDCLILLLIIFDLFVIKTGIDIYSLFVVVMILFRIKREKEKMKALLKVLLYFLIVSIGFLFIGQEQIFEKLLVYQYIFTVCYILIEVIKLKNNNE